MDLFSVMVACFVVAFAVILGTTGKNKNRVRDSESSPILGVKRPGEPCNHDEECQVECKNGICICIGNYKSKYKEISTCSKDKPICHEFKCQRETQKKGESCERDDVCGNGLYCVLETCRECTGDGDCPDGTYCNAHNECVPGKSCNLDKDCSDTTYCWEGSDPNTCKPKRPDGTGNCKRNAQCESGNCECGFLGASCVFGYGDCTTK